MIVSLIGPGDIEFHFHQLLKVPKGKLEKTIEEIAQALVDADVEIELLPDNGICFEIAKAYKQIGGKRVIGTIPQDDTTFGIEHLKQYRDYKINKQPLFDEIINSGDWYKHDLIKGLWGNVILSLGLSPGEEGERQYAVYLYKLIKRFKQGVDVSAKRIHPQLRVDDNFSVIAYSPFIINKRFQPEDEAYMKKFGIDLFYADNSKELTPVLKKLSNKFN